MADDCPYCHKPFVAHWSKSGWNPPAGCRANDISAIRRWATGKITAPRSSRKARKIYYALPAAKLIDFEPGTPIAHVNEVILRAGAEGISVAEILKRVRRIRGMSHMTAQKLPWYLSELRKVGAAASVRPIDTAG